MKSPVLASIALLALASCSKPPAAAAPGPDPVAPTVTCSIAEGTADIQPSLPSIVLTASEAIDPATVIDTNITLSSSSGLGYPLTFVVSEDGLTLTLTPAGLDEHKHYTLFVSGLKATAKLGGLKMKTNLQVHFATVGVPPRIIETTPIDGTNGVSLSGLAPKLTFSEPVVDTTPTSIQLKHGTDLVDADISFDTNGKIATISPVGLLYGNATYTVVLGAGLVDADDQEPVTGTPKTVLTFTTAAIPPVLRDVQPQDSTIISLTSNFVLTFSRPMNPDTLNTTNIVLTTDGGTNIPITLAVDSLNEIVTVTPTSMLTLGTSYLLLITTAVKDYSNIPLVDPYTYHYSTQPPPAAVSSVDPADGTMDAPLGAHVTVQFTVPVLTAQVTMTSFKVTETNGGAVVAGVLSPEQTGNSATFYPAGEFKPLTDYTVTVTSDIHDQLHNVALIPFVSHFKTQQEPAPEVVEISCQGMPGTTMCAAQTEIVVTFSRPVIISTVTTSTFFMTAMGSSTPEAITPTVPGAGTAVTSGTASLLPGAALSAPTTFTVTLTNGITNAAGIPMVPFTWQFTTM